MKNHDKKKRHEIKIRSFGDIKQMLAPHKITPSTSYFLYVDGEMTIIKNARSLDRVLKQIYGKEPMVYANAAGGVTIDFDNT